MHIRYLFMILAIAFTSCGGTDKKPASTQTIDTLNYQFDDTTIVADTISVNDSLLQAMKNRPVPEDDTTALQLKARLAADTASTTISDNIKKDIYKAREYMNKKQKPK